MKRIKLILLLMLMAGNCCLAQRFAFKHLGTGNGLLSDLRLVMAEDRIGRLWIGSDEGLNVFDGSGVGTYSLPDNSGLNSNNIQLVLCDNRGTIWIKSPNGIQYKKEAEVRFSNINSSNT